MIKFIAVMVILVDDFVILRSGQMGVAGFFNWIMKRYPSICRNVGKGVKPTFDCFFIDFNCIIHTALNKIKGAEDKNNQELISEVLRHLDTLVRVIKPTKLLYIAVDGPTPFAKCIEQRSRRFRSKSDLGSDEGFSKNEITVGSEFMERLHQEILTFIQDRVENDPAWSNPNVIYDSYHTPGEGEHKLVEFIRKQRLQNNWNEDYACCVYSPDADIFFIILNTQIKKMAVLKDDSGISYERSSLSKQANQVPFRFFADQFVFIYISILRELMLVDLVDNDKQMLNRVISDFCAIGFFLGNDYIPNFPHFKLDSGDFDIALEVYCSVCIPQKKFIIENNNYNFSNFADYLKELSVAIANKNGSCLKFDQILKSEKSEFKRNFPPQVNFEDKIKDLVYAVLDSFVWVEHLYTKGCNSWSWYYPYTMAPPLSVISQYLDGYEPKFELGQPPLPFACLISLLPAKSSRFLPTCLQPLASSSSPIFHVMNGDSKSLSFNDFENIIKIVKDAEPNYTKEEKVRNSIFNPLLINFKSDPTEIDISKKFNFKNNPINSIFPSFESLPLVLNIKNRPGISSENSLIIEAILKNQEPTDIKSMSGLKGKVILVDYPFFTPALVTKVISTPNKPLFKETKCLEFTRKPKITVIARPIQYLNYNHTSYSWGAECAFPLIHTAPLSCFDKILDDLQEENKYKLAPNMTAFISQGRFAPSLCKIKTINGSKVMIHLIQRTFNKDISNLLNDDNDWIKIGNVANSVGISVNSLRILMGPITTPKYGRNVGMKVLKKNKGSDGYVKTKQGELFVTNDLAECIKNYVKFLNKDLIQILKSSKSSEDFTDKFQKYLDSEGDDAIEINKTMADYVSEISPGYKSSMKNLSAFSVSSKTYQTIESAIEQFENEDIIGNVKTVDVSDLIWEGTNKANKFEIGDHVCVVSRTGTIPFGTSGTVIATLIQNTVSQIVSDYPLKYGSTMIDTFKQPRICYVQNCDLVKF